MRARVLVLVLLSACDRSSAPIAQTAFLPDANVVTTMPAAVDVADATNADAGASAVDASAAPATPARGKRPPAHRAEPTNCGQHPDQPGCNCFTNRPHSTCFDP
jgi:hypothetical protein